MMQTLKSPKNVLFIVIVSLVLGIQIVYLAHIRTKVVREILDIQSESQLKQAEVVAQERQLQRMPQIKQELEQVEAQKNGVKESIPTEISSIKAFIELMRLMEANGFRETKIEQVEQIPHEDETLPLIETCYRLNYVSSYNESKNFINHLNNAYQLINVTSFTVDNVPQTQRENLDYYGDQLGQVVHSTVEFSLFTIEGQAGEKEIYTPSATLTNNSYEAFVNREQALAIEQSQENVLAQPIMEQSAMHVDTFNLNLWDELVSGENYTFASPGPIDRLYTGLSSGDNVYITLTVREEGYDVVLEDEAGQVSQNSALIAIDHPSLGIDCKMVQIKEEMPVVKIYIKNYTPTVIDVKLTGSLLENIFIYNEYDERVLPGQTKGNVKLT